tara:strand:+ start:524 stop:1045 length:522 start_codon:yes stop_codon:yes gene_type:complete
MSKLLNDLRIPFPEEDIEWRIQQSGLSNGLPWALVLAYVTNRAIMDRLDDVVGPENWTNDFTQSPNGGVLCTLGIRVRAPMGDTNPSDDIWVHKTDGADNTEIERVKGGLSNAMKRAGVQWGIGRYLYKLPTTFAKFESEGRFKARIDGSPYRWSPPKLEEEFLPPKPKNKKQ